MKLLESVLEISAQAGRHLVITPPWLTVYVSDKHLCDFKFTQTIQFILDRKTKCNQMKKNPFYTIVKQDK